MEFGQTKPTESEENSKIKGYIRDFAGVGEPKPYEKACFLSGVSVIIILMLLSLLPVWNILFHLNTQYIGGGELEGWLWRYWWFKQMMSSLFSQDTWDWSLILYTYLCAGNYPETGNVFDLQTLSLILEPIFGDPAYYNIKVIIVLFLNGIAGYTFAKYLTKNPIISVLGGAILIINPYVSYELANGRIRQTMLFSMPLFVMYLIENYHNPRLKSAILAGFWLGITGAIYLFYGMAALFFGLIFIIVQLCIDHRNFKFSFLKYVVIMLVLFVLITAPFCFRYIEMTIRGESLPEVLYNTDFPSLSFLLQNDRNINTGSPLPQSILRCKIDSPPALYPFYIYYILNIPIILTILALFPLVFRRPFPWLWIITFIFFYVLTLGPYLRHGFAEDNYVRVAFNQPIPLLYTLFFKYVPFFSRLFSPIRMMGMMYVALTALAVTNLAYLIDKLYEKLNPPIKVCKLIAVTLTLLIIFAISFQMFKANQIPILLTNAKYPDIYNDIAREKEDIKVIELPFGLSDCTNYYQMYHGKKVLWGWNMCALPKGFPESRAKYLAQMEDVENNTFINFLIQLNRQPAIPPVFQPSDLEKLRDMGYRYIILHEKCFHEMNISQAGLVYEYFLRQLTKALGAPDKICQEEIRWLLPSSPKPDRPFHIAVFKIR